MYQVVNLARNVAELEQQLDRAHRDKSSLKNQLEDALCKLSSQEHDHAKVNLCSVQENINCI